VGSSNTGEIVGISAGWVIQFCATTTTWVPLLDQDGSTLGLVSAANPDAGPVTTYTYDPSGTPSPSGTANDWPFQYQGMEKEFTDPAPYYYSGT
jgi:hypothetical protein